MTSHYDILTRRKWSKVMATETANAADKCVTGITFKGKSP